MKTQKPIMFPGRPIIELGTPSWFPPDQELVRFFRGYSNFYRWIYPNYRIELLRTFARLWPDRACSVLDVGAGDGVFGSAIQRYYPGVTVRGVDVASRAHPASLIPIQVYDGSRIPADDKSVDISIVANVIHHVPPSARSAFLCEVSRVTRRAILIKDHIATGSWSRLILSAMDFVGNVPFKGMIEASYLDAGAWTALFADCKMSATVYRQLRVLRGPRTLIFPDNVEIAIAVPIES